MTQTQRRLPVALCLALAIAMPAAAHDYREKGKPVLVANGTIQVVPPRDWNKLGVRPGKKAETWTLDGEQLNDVTFFGDIAPGEPLVRERSKTRKPFPKFALTTLLAEVPELLESTYRTANGIGDFKMISSAPDKFLGTDGIRFSYEYVDSDTLPRRGEARASLIKGALYMITYDAPRLSFYDRNVADFRALADTASLK